VRYGIVDIANLYHRCLHVADGDAYTRAGMALSIIFLALGKLHREQALDHVVICTEGGSWRYAVFPQYKAKRRAERLNKSLKEQDDDAVAAEVFEGLLTFFREKTNCTVLSCDGIEGDDFVARFIQLHPDDEHVVLSSDSDFVQLLAPNVTLVDGVAERVITLEQVTDKEGNALTFTINTSNGRLKVGKPIEVARVEHEKAQDLAEAEHKRAEDARASAHLLMEERRALENPSHLLRPYEPVPFTRTPFEFTPEPDWHKKALFVKIVRGDSSDSIFSSYPGVRFKGTKDRTGIEEAWADRNGHGFDWNNFMLQTWEKLIGADENGNPIKKMVRVMDEFSFNAGLIDLTQQPDEIKELIDSVIVEAVQKKPIGQVGVHFLRFCGENDLPRLAGDAARHAAYLKKPYAG
jgi:hypothetical protein